MWHAVVLFAQTPLTLQQAVTEALRNSPQILASQARTAAAEGDRHQAGLAPNPRLYVQTENARFWGSTPFSFPNSTDDYGYVGQVVEVAGKRARRVEVATAGVRFAASQNLVVARGIRYRVGSAYWMAAGAARIRELLEQSLQTYEENVTYHRNRVREGAMAEADLLRIELERDRVRFQVLAATREAEQATVALFRAMEKTEFPAVTFADSLENVPDISIPELATALEQRPEMQSARENLSRSEASVRLQQANAKPDPDFYLGYKRTAGLDTLYGAVQVDLPFRNRNQGAIEAAQALVRAAKADLASTEVGIRGEWESATRAYQAGRVLFRAFPETRARAAETARIAQAAYREGGFDLVRLLDAERIRIDTEVQYYRALMELQQSTLTLLFASGRALP